MAGTNALIALIRNAIPRNWNVIALRRTGFESRKSTGSTKLPRMAMETARIIFILAIFILPDSANCFAGGVGGTNEKGRVFHSRLSATQTGGSFSASLAT